MAHPTDDDADLAVTVTTKPAHALVDRDSFQPEIPPKLGRFELVRCIGRGSLGVVYEARDPDHGGRIALKLLRRVDGTTIAQFKHEFRVLSGITHPNLVALHELVCDQDQWFVTMELIDGVPFDRWLWPHPEHTLDLDRLRAALAQLVAAVRTIHHAGKLHRDLKPSNVLVTAGGRVVVLDFGLVSARELAPPTPPSLLVGTPAYMAPEQAAREPAQEASDWYAVGVMLFEVLTHRLPFDGRAREVLRDKRQRSAPRVRDLVPSICLDLDRLCRGLLERDPTLRLGANAVEAWLGRARLPQRRFSSAETPVLAPSELIGRDAELRLLAAKLDQMPAAVWLRAAPGLGKTALLDAFAARVTAHALVLRARCHEGESIPLKVFDAIADALRELLDSAAFAPHVTPSAEDAAALAQAFPALGEARSIARAANGCSATSDPFAALRRLLAKLAANRPLAILVDDLHWGDPGSAARFHDVFGDPDAPACLFVGAFRGGETGSCEFVQLAAAAGDLHLPLPPLPERAASVLAQHLLRAQGVPATPELSRRLARETGGVPSLLHELVRHAKRPRRSSARGPSSTGAIAFGTALRSRVDALPEPARRLLEVVCVATEPLSLRLALSAAALPPDEHVALAQVRTENLLRSGGDKPRETLEPYHEQVRRAVLEHLSLADRQKRQADLDEARRYELQERRDD